MTESTPPAPSSSKQPEHLVCNDDVDSEDETLGIVLSLLSCISLNSSNTMLLMSAVLDSAQGNPLPLTSAAANTSTAVATTPAVTLTPSTPAGSFTAASQGPLVPSPVATIGAPAPSTRTHSGRVFKVPDGPVTGTVYLVTRGRRIGIFASWQLTSPHVTSVSRAVFSCWPSVEAGITAMEEAINANAMEILP